MSRLTSLRTKTVLTAVAFFAVLILGFFAVSHAVAKRTAAELERDAVRKDVERVLGVLEREVAALDDFAWDWASWDDTYAFVEDGNEEYVRSNLVDTTFEGIRANYIVLLDRKGRAVYARGYDPRAGRDIPVPTGLAASLFRAGQEPEAKKGIVALPEGLMLVAARPILKSDESGPARGVLIFARVLTAGEAARLSEAVRLPLSLLPPGAVDLGRLEPAGRLESGEPFWFAPESPSEGVAYTVLRDIRGGAALILRVGVPRQAAAVLGVVRRLGLVLALLLGVVAGAAAIFWLDRAVLLRLKRLTDEVAGVGGNPGRVGVLPGGDELSLLSAEINRMVERLEKRDREYREVVENAAEAIVVVQDGVMKFANPAAAGLTGRRRSELVGAAVADLVHPEDRKEVLARTRRPAGGAPGACTFAFRVMAGDGTARWVEANTVAVEWEGGPATLSFLTDVSARQLLEEELRRLAAEKTLILDSLVELVLYLDRDMHIIWANRAAAASVGMSPEELWGAKCHQIWRGRDLPCAGCPVVRAMETGRVSAGEIASPDGRYWHITASPVTDEAGNVIGAVETTLEVTERKRYEEQLKYLSLHDQLTGLYNRAFFEEELKRLAGGRDYPITVLVADLDGLKLVNDTLGHAKGDEMLKACAGILRASLRRSDILARIGGDEFAVLLPRMDEKAAAEIARRITARVGEHNAQHPELPLHLSWGYATSKGSEEPLEETFRKADDLMYRHKLMHRTSARNQIISALLAVLEEKDFVAAGHAQRVEEWCLKVGERIGLSPRQTADLALLARVHDLGKVAVPDSVLFKKGPLTEEELNIMRQHCERGYRIALSSPDLAGVADLILKHHERWDGTGYPLGLKGDEIPVECRILAIADAFDAMTSRRPYREPVPVEAALAELKRCAGSQFDPHLVEVFASVVSA